MNKKYLLQDLVDKLSTVENLKKKESADYLKTFFKAFEDNLLRDKIVKINGLGAFKLIEVEDRSSVDVNTGKSFLIKRHYKLNFLPDNDLKEEVNKPFSAFVPVETDNTDEETTDKIQDESFVGQVEGNNVAEGKAEENDWADIVNEVINEEKNISETNASPINETQSENLIGLPVTDQSVIKKSNVKDRNVSRGMLWFFLFLLVAVIVFWTVKSNHDAKVEYQKKIGLFEKFKDNTSPDAATLDSSAVYEEYKKEDSILAAIETDIMSDSILHAQAAIKAEKQAGKKTVEPTVKTTSRSVTGKRVKNQTSSGNSKKYPLYETLQPGSRLTLLAEKYYGHKIFWVYIYLDNKDIIKDPNNVPAGTKIRISKPDSSKIKANDPECIEKATTLQRKILEQFGN